MTYSRQLTKNGHTNRLRNSLFVQICSNCTNRKASFFDKSYCFTNGTIAVGVLTNPYVYIFFRARVRHTGPTDFLAWWVGHFRVPFPEFCVKEFLFAWELKSYFHIISFRHLASLWNNGLEQLGNGLAIIYQNSSHDYQKKQRAQRSYLRP